MWADSMREWGILGRTYPEGPDLELVALVDHPGGSDAAGEPLRTQFFVMRLSPTGRWRVAGIGRSLAAPGWPPTEERIGPPE
jgi:hypothetical protein